MTTKLNTPLQWKYGSIRDAAELIISGAEAKEVIRRANVHDELVRLLDLAAAELRNVGYLRASEGYVARLRVLERGEECNELKEKNTEAATWMRRANEWDDLARERDALAKECNELEEQRNHNAKLGEALKARAEWAEHRLVASQSESEYRATLLDEARTELTDRIERDGYEDSDRSTRLLVAKLEAEHRGRGCK